MTHEEKLEVAELLDEMGVDIIEAGFPIASEGDFAAVNEIAKRTKQAVVCGLARAGQKDIDRCGEAIKPAKRGRIHTFISTSPVHMKWKLQMEPQKVYRNGGRLGDARAQLHRRRRMVVPRMAPAARSISFAAASRPRSRPAPRTINIPDTVGYTVPEEYFAADQNAARTGAEFRQGALLRALP